MLAALLPLLPHLVPASATATEPLHFAAELRSELEPTGSSPGGLTLAGDLLFFVADSGSGAELWVEDGTGPRLVADLETFGASAPTDLTAAGSRLFFAADLIDVGAELFVSDGTAAGTRLVKDIYPGTGSSSPEQITAVGDGVFFLADDGLHGLELWVSDGTEAGTTRMADIAIGAAPCSCHELTAVADVLFFVADDGFGPELWTSDGTVPGTVVLPLALTGFSDPHHLTAAGGFLYFTADDGNGVELWVGFPHEDPVRLDVPLTAGGAGPTDLTAVGNDLYFVGPAGTGLEPYFVRGTTKTLRQVNLADTSGSDPQQLTATTDTLYLVAGDGVNGRELFALTPTTMNRITNIATPAPSLVLLAATTDAFYFAIDTGTLELHRTAGITDEQVSFTAASSIAALATVGTTIFLAADYNNGNGVEVFRTSGAEPTMSSLNLGVPPSDPHGAKVLHNRVYFAATSSNTGTEYYDMDPASEPALHNLNLDTTSGNPTELTGLDTDLFFVADDNDDFGKVWRNAATLDTPAPAVVQTIPNPVTNTLATQLEVSGGKLYFIASDGAGRELYLDASGDTAAVVTGLDQDSVVLIDDVVDTLYIAADAGGVPSILKTTGDGTATALSAPTNVTAEEFWGFGDYVYARAVDAAVPRLYAGQRSGTTLTDTTVTGPDELTLVGSAAFLDGGLPATPAVLSIATPGAVPIEIQGPDSAGTSLYDWNGTLLFAADSLTHGDELWQVAPGSAAATLDNLVSDSAGIFGSSPRDFTTGSTHVYFVATDPDLGAEIWSYDGTHVPTAPDLDIRPGVLGSDPTGLVWLGNVLFFFADDGVHGREPWVDDDAGPRLLVDLRPGLLGSRPGQPCLLPGGRGVLFSADDGVHGSELWLSDGRPEGTHLLQDIAVGPEPSWPTDLTVVNDTVFFAARTPELGNELWMGGPIADLGITVEGTAPGASAGYSASFTVTLTNVGPGTSAEAGVTLVLTGAGLASVTPSQGSCDTGASPPACDLGTIGSGSPVTVTVEVEGDAGDTATLTATAAAPAGIDATLLDNEATASAQLVNSLVTPTGCGCRGSGSGRPGDGTGTSILALVAISGLLGRAMRRRRGGPRDREC